MGLKTGEIIETGEDVVRSSLAEAYEVGVSSYGDRPDDQRTLEPAVTFKSNDVTKFEADPHSEKLDLNKHQKIASYQFHIDEIPRIKDLMHAKYVEDAIDRAIVDSIVDAIYNTSDLGFNSVDLNYREQLKSFFDQMRDQVTLEFNTVTETQTILNKLVGIIYEFERIMAKGNLLRYSQKYADNAYTSQALNQLSVIRRQHSYSPMFWKNFSNQNNTILAKLPPSLASTAAPGSLQKLSYIINGDESFVHSLAKMQTTAIIAQFCKEVEIILDYGLPERFFRGAGPHLYGGSRPSIHDKLAGMGDNSPFMQHYATPIVYGAEHTGNPAEKNISSLYQPLCSLFNYRYNIDEGSVEFDTVIGPHSNPHRNTRQERNPLFSLPKNALTALGSSEGLIYLASIIEREITMSQGIGSLVSQLAVKEAYDHFAASVGESVANEVERRDGVGAGQVGVVARATGTGKLTPLGTRVFGTLQHDDELGQSTPVHEWIKATGMYLKRFKQNVPGTEGLQIMPFELVSGDVDTKDFLMGKNTESFKSQIVDKMYEDPMANIASSLNMHREVGGAIVDQHEHTEKFIASMCPTLSQTESTRSVSRTVISRAYDDIADLLGKAQFADKANTGTGTTAQVSRGQMAASELLGLARLFTPEGEGCTDNHRFLKKHFINRLCLIDQTQYAKVHQKGVPMGGVGAGSVSGYSFVNETYNDVFLQGENFHKPRHSQDFRDYFMDRMVHTCQPSWPTDAEYPGAEQFTRQYTNFLMPGSNRYWNVAGSHMELPEYEAGTGAYFLGGYNSDVYLSVKNLIKAIAQCCPDKRPTIMSPTSVTADGVPTDFEEAVMGTNETPYFQLKSNDIGVFHLESGFHFINTIYGPGTHSDEFILEDASSYLLYKILATVDFIIDANYDVGFLYSQQLCRNGATFANGMDKSQLIAYVLEIYSIIANDIIDGHFIHSAHASSIDFSNMTSIYSGADLPDAAARFTVNSSKFTKQAPDQWALPYHLIGITPKSAEAQFDINSDDLVSYPAGIQNVPTLEEYTFIISFMGQKCTNAIQANKSYLEYYVECKEELKKNFGDQILNKSKIFIENVGTPDILIGGMTTLKSVYYTYARLSEYECCLPYTFSGLAEIIGYYRTAFSIGVGRSDQTSDSVTASVEELATTIEESDLSPDVIKNYMESITARQVIEILDSTTRFSEAFNHNSGYDITSGNFNLETACQIVLNSFEGFVGDFVNVIVLGLSLDSQRDAALKEINKDALLSSDFYDLQNLYRIKFSKTSELNTFLDFTQDTEVFPPIEFNAGYVTSLYWINKGVTDIGLSNTSSIDDLVDATLFYRLSIGENFGQINEAQSGYILGSSLIGSAPTPEMAQELREQLTVEVKSKVMMYVLEVILQIPVSAQTLSYQKCQTMSRSTLHLFLKGLKHCTQFAKDSGDFDVDAVLDALFETDDVYKGKIEDPVRLKRSDTELAEAFKPKLVRTGMQTAWQDPIVSQELFLIIQAIMKSLWLTVSTPEQHLFSCIDESLLRPRIFDTSVALTSPNLFAANAYRPEVSSASTDTLGEESLSFVDAELLDQVKNSPFKINNYSALIMQALKKMSG